VPGRGPLQDEPHTVIPEFEGQRPEIVCWSHFHPFPAFSRSEEITDVTVAELSGRSSLTSAGLTCLGQQQTSQSIFRTLDVAEPGRPERSERSKHHVLG